MAGLPPVLLIFVMALIALVSGTYIVHHYHAAKIANKAQKRMLRFAVPQAIKRNTNKGHGLISRYGLHAFHKIGLLSSLQTLAVNAGHNDQKALGRIAIHVVISALLTTGLFAFVASFFDTGLSGFILLLAIGVYIGGAIPLILLILKGKRRLKAIEDELPFCLDIIVVQLRGGNSIEQCFRQLLSLGEDSFPEINKATQSLIHDIDHGKPYAAALDRWATHLAIPSAQSLSSLFQQALHHGTEISANLIQMSEFLIEKRLQNARIRAGRVLPQITVVMMVFLLPPMFTVLAAPAITQLTRQIGAL